MRKIEQDACRHLYAKTPFRRDNTAVILDGDDSVLLLHGHEIARFNGRRLILSDAGWQTVTTKSRLNAVLEYLGAPYRIAQKRWQWYIGNKEWPGQARIAYDSGNWFLLV